MGSEATARKDADDAGKQGRPGGPGKFRTRVAKLAYSLSRPSLWRALRKGVAPGIEHRSAIASLGCATVIDVGANCGQFALLALEVFPGAIVHSFEPIPEEAQTFRSLLAANPRVRLRECGLGSRSASLLLHLSAARDSSSFLPIGALQRTAFPGTDETGQITVQVRRLDEILGVQDLKGPALLKIDVQGYELEVLKGAVGILEHIDFIYAELSSQELYEGQPRRAEVEAFLAQAGFRTRGEFNPTYFEGRLLQADFLFEQNQPRERAPRG